MKHSVLLQAGLGLYCISVSGIRSQEHLFEDPSSWRETVNSEVIQHAALSTSDESGGCLRAYTKRANAQRAALPNRSLTFALCPCQRTSRSNSRACHSVSLVFLRGRRSTL